MDKAHEIARMSFSGNVISLNVDGRHYEIDLARQSDRLARATQAQRENVDVSPSGYGLHWPDLDEDLSIDGLIGITHSVALTRTNT
jgi:hypothetical protein